MTYRMRGCCLDLPGVPSSFWPVLLMAAGGKRIALVGGAVRDLLLHHQHLDQWRGLVDLDLVIEDPLAFGAHLAKTRPEKSSPAWKLVERLSRTSKGVVVRAARPHGQYGTVEMELEFDLPSTLGVPQGSSTRLVLDVASARSEHYPVPAENPVVRLGALVDDLARRDFTINAMAIDIATGTVLDPHNGEADLADRILRLLHPKSLQDDPTRLLRAARYAARLGFELAPESLAQAASTLADWPWPWRFGDPPERAPAGLGTRLGREMELLLERENWLVGLAYLQAWGGLLLFDPLLQVDRFWKRRLNRATRLRLPLMVALLAGAEDPLALAERLQLPHRYQLMLHHFAEFRLRMAGWTMQDGDASLTPWQWCQRLEAPGLSPEAVALALACEVAPRRPLLRWLLRWRHLGPDHSAQQLMDAGVPKGPELGRELKRSRQGRLERERP
jgi:poly(A) polymerase